MEYVLLVVGFLLLVKGADLFVDGSSSLAKTLKIPSVIIGLTIVAMGTSAPEASVSINAAFVGNNDIAISNVLGSNIFNQLVVVGLCASLMPFFVERDIIKRDMPINILVSILLLDMILDGTLNRYEGIILLAGMVIYMITMIRAALKNRTEEEVQVLSLPKSLFFIGIGLAAVIFGGDFVVDSASAIALSLGLSQNFVGLTIVAVGTSLPELVTSLVATKKGESGLALGNAIGSNIFNILFILGASASLAPLTILSESILDAIILLVVSILMFIFAYTGKKMERKEGWICVVAYVAYTISLFMR